jgi:very-short-patch-repair endonuclease
LNQIARLTINKLSHYPTISDVLKSPCAGRNQHLVEANGVVKKIIKARNDCKEVQWIAWQLKYWCIEKGVRLEKEFKFAKGRRYRADFALPDQMIIVEYEGIFSQHSRHTNKIGYSKDTDKYRLAEMEGYTVLRYTALNFKNVIQDLEKIIK